MATMECLLGLLLFLETAGLQFSSTILLSDTYASNIAGDVAIMDLPSFVSPNQLRTTTTQHLYRLQEPSFSIYGERKANITSMPNLDGLSDTGIVERVLLPIANAEDRKAVRTYEGGAVVLSSRVACMRPKLQDFQFGASAWEEHEGSDFGELNATLDYDISL